MMNLKSFFVVIVILLVMILSACGSAPTSDTLTVCTLGLPENERSTPRSQANSLVKQLAEKSNESGGSPRIEVKEIPATVYPDGQEEQEAFLKRMQVEVMSGKGPDLFILPTVSMHDEKNLFENPEKSMAAGAFADLSEFTKADPQWEALIAPVMEAGTYDGKQYLIPLKYGYPMMVMLREEFDKLGLDLAALTESTDGFLTEAAASDHIPWRRSATELVVNYFYSCFDQSAIDYKGQTLNLKEPEVLGILEQYQTLSKGISPQAPAASGGTRGLFVPFDQVLTPEVPAYAPMFYDTVFPVIAELKYTGKDYLTIPLKNSRGNITPVVTYYGAVSASCKNPQAAYDFISLFLSPTAQSGAIGSINLNGKAVQADASNFDAFLGWPVRGDLDIATQWEHFSKNFYTEDVLNANITLTEADIAPPVELLNRGRIQCQLDTDFRLSLFSSYYKEEEIAPPVLAEKLYKLLQAAAVE